MAPATAVEVSGDLKIASPLGRFWRERREIGLRIGEGFEVWEGGGVMLRDLALNMTIDAMVAAIRGSGCEIEVRSKCKKGKEAWVSL